MPTEDNSPVASDNTARDATFTDLKDQIGGHPNMPGGVVQEPAVLGQAPVAPAAAQPGSPAQEQAAAARNGEDGIRHPGLGHPMHMSAHVVKKDDDGELQREEVASKPPRAMQKGKQAAVVDPTKLGTNAEVQQNAGK